MQRTGDTAAWDGCAPISSPLAGVAADRFDRRKVLLAAQVFMMTCTAVLTALTFPGLITPVLILALSLGVGVGFAVHAPTWQSTVPHLVPREMLTSAVALNSAQVSTARIAGPAACATPTRTGRSGGSSPRPPS